MFDVLLGVLGEGRLSDSDGRFVDFRMTMIVMTSNLGVATARPLGFGEAAGASSLASVRAHFRPELVNRIDHVVTFAALRPEDMVAIVDLEMKKANARTGLVRRGITLRLDGAARERIAELGYDPARGARPLLRVIEERVMTPVAMRIAGDPAMRGQAVVISLADVEGAGAPVAR